ncbi:MAG: hypothetical protein ACJ74O_10985 [Frankiaceae bacterium]
MPSAREQERAARGTASDEEGDAVRLRRGGLALATLAIAGVYAVPLASAHLAARA